MAGQKGKDPDVHRSDRPWELPDGPPEGYSEPMVDHKAERQEELDRTNG
jgi:deoxyribodipyrimidine photo-lyase